MNFYAEDPDRGFLGPLSVPQLQCMIIFFAAVLLYVRGFQLSQGSAAQARVATHPATPESATVSTQVTAPEDRS